MKVLDRGRLHISAVACGMAQRILNEAVAYARERKQFGKRIGDFQLVQAMLADSQAELYAGWSMVQAAALRYDAKGTSSITHLSRVSRPGRRVYVGAGEIPRVLGGYGINIVSTSQGLMSGKKARKENIGGEILAQVY